MDNIITRTDYDMQQGDRYRLLPKGDSTPTDPKWKEYDRQLKARKRKEQQITGGDATQPMSVPHEEKPTVVAVDSALTPE